MRMRRCGIYSMEAGVCAGEDMVRMKETAAP